MTNEVTTQTPAIPAFLQAHMAANNGGKPSADLASLATAQNSTPRLSLRGKIFRFMEGQDEVYKNKDAILVHIVGVEPGPGLFTKTYYSKPYGGADASGEPPDCASADGVRPDPWIQQPVHHECKSCPKNQFGSATSRRGRPSKACHDSKRLFVVRGDAGDDVKDTPVPERTLYLSQVPVSSLKELSDYGKEIQDMNVEPWMVQTKLTMDEDSEFPTLKFEVAGFISEGDMPKLKERAGKREWAKSRNMMIEGQAQRPALPAHLQSALGGAAAAPVQSNLGAPAAEVLPASTAAPGTSVAGMGGDASNANVLKNW